MGDPPNTAPPVASATPRTAAAPPARRRVPAWLPAQHGAWSLLGVGLSLAWISAGHGGPAGLAAATAAVTGFIACHAATARSRRRRRAALPTGVAALAALLVAGMCGAPPVAALPLAGAALLGCVATYGLHRLGPRATVPLLISTVGLGLATWAVAIAARAAAPAALAAGALLALHGGSRLFAVRGAMRGDAGRALAWSAALAPLVLVAGAALAGGGSAWFAAAFLPGVAVTAWWAAGATPPTPRRCGRYELAAAVGFLILAGIGLVPR